MGCCEKSKKKESKIKLSIIPNKLSEFNLGIKDIKICLSGNSGVGKTNFFASFFNKNYDNKSTDPSGDNDAKILEINETKYNISIWDTAGQEDYMQFTKIYFNGCNFIILLFSRNDENSYNDIQKKWIPFLEQNKDLETKIIIFENKNDLPINFDTNQLKNYCNLNKINYYQGSGLKKININETILDIIEKM